MTPVNGTWLQTIATALGETDCTTKTWQQELCKHFGITEPVNGSWMYALCVYFDVDFQDGEPLIQSLAEDFGATAPVNGTWVEALANQMNTSSVAINALASRVEADGGVMENQTKIVQKLPALDEAAWVYIAGPYKEGKLYTALPLDGSGDMTFTRLSSAERVNSSLITESVGNNVPRIDYSTGEGALMLEAQGTNLLQYSNDLSQNVWGKGNVTISGDQVTMTSNFGIVNQNIAVTPGSTYTYSFFAKRGTATDLKYCVYNVTNFTDIIAPTSYYAQTNSSDYTRITITFTAPTGCTTARVYPLRDSGATGTVFIKKQQCETGLIATSYIDSLGAITTRIADLAIDATADVYLPGDSGTMYLEFKANQNGVAGKTFTLYDSTAPGKLVYINVANVADRISAGCYNGSVTVTTPFNGVNQTNKNKIVLTYGDNLLSIYVNGVLGSSNTYTGTLDSFDRLSFCFWNNGSILQGYVYAAAIWNRKLTLTEIQAL